MTTVGILGAGQLGRMLALAGYPLGLHFRFLDPTDDAPVDMLADRLTGEYTDQETLDLLSASVDIVTYEFENVPVQTARYLAERVQVYPPPEALEVAQDRMAEKSFFQGLDIATPRFAAVDTYDDLTSAITTIELPAVLKTRRMGYDGKGQFVIHNQGEIAAAWETLGGAQLILEGFVSFDREVSIIAARGPDGATAFYPLVENTHREGILRLSQLPARGITQAHQTQAEGYAHAVMSALNYVGILAIELFQVGDELLVNEMAPRVHNSGHWTIDGASTSQFEQHLRAILGLPLGATTTREQIAMLNCIGDLPDDAAVLAVMGAHLHRYDKAPRPGRKVGHVTLIGTNTPSFTDSLAHLRTLVKFPEQ